MNVVSPTNKYWIQSCAHKNFHRGLWCPFYTKVEVSTSGTLVLVLAFICINSSGWTGGWIETEDGEVYKLLDIPLGNIGNKGSRQWNLVPSTSNLGFTTLKYSHVIFFLSLSLLSSRNCLVSQWHHGNKSTLPFCPSRLDTLAQIPHFLPDLARRERFAISLICARLFSTWRDATSRREQKEKSEHL